nr:TPA_asm: P [Cucurbita betacytorhabdovirus 1]
MEKKSEILSNLVNDVNVSETIDSFMEDPDNFEMNEPDKVGDHDSDHESPFGSLEDPSMSKKNISPAAASAVPEAKNEMTLIEVIKESKEICKKLGIEYQSEYLDIITAIGSSAGRSLTKQEVFIFFKGIETERRYGLTLKIKDISTQLEGSLKRVSNMEKDLSDKLKEKDSIIVSELKGLKTLINEKPIPSVVTHKNDHLVPPTTIMSPYAAFPRIKYGPEAMDSVPLEGIPKGHMTTFEDAARAFKIDTSYAHEIIFQESFRAQPKVRRALLAAGMLTDEAIHIMYKEIKETAKTLKENKN